MIKVAICDDETYVGANLEEIIKKIEEMYSIEFNIDVFLTGEGLCNYLEKGNVYDLIFLDIELKTTDGIKVGKFVRKKYGINVTQLVYISAKEKYALQLFKIRPLDFIIKPIRYKAVEEVIQTAFEIMNRNNTELFEYSFGKDVYKIPAKDIIYFESVNRKVYIYGNEKKEEFYGTIKDIFEKVNKFDFVWIHKSYLVNFSYIAKFSYDHVILTNDIVLPIAQSKRKHVRSIILNCEQ